MLVAMCAGGMTIASCQDDAHKATTGARKSPTHSAPPTPSASGQVATAIREELRRMGTGSATLTSYENAYKTVSRYQVDCASSRPRSEFRITTPGRQGQPKDVHLKIVTDGSRLYSRALNGPMSTEDKP